MLSGGFNWRRATIYVEEHVGQAALRVDMRSSLYVLDRFVVDREPPDRFAVRDRDVDDDPDIAAVASPLRRNGGVMAMPGRRDRHANRHLERHHEGRSGPAYHLV